MTKDIGEMMEIQLPQGTGSVKHTRPYNTMTKNQKFVYDLCYDEINGPLFFAENCCYVNRNGLEHYKPFDYQREMIFNMHNYKRLISLFSRQNGKCCLGKSMVKIRNKKTNEINEITIKDFFETIKNKKYTHMIEDKKFVESFDVDDWEVLTDTGWEDIVKIHKTIPYKVWKIQTKSFELECADKHLVFNKDMFPTYIDELKVGDEIWTENGLEKITLIQELEEEENMYDLELSNSSNHRYYTSGILSHNTITTAIYLLWFAMKYDHKDILICAQSKDASMENLSKIKMAYEYCPDFLKKGLISDNKSTLEFDNGSRIAVRAANIKAPRGLSPAIVYVDEFAFIGSQDSADKALQLQQEFYAALTPALSATGGKLFITSTPMSETDLFYRIYSGSIKKVDDKGLDLPSQYILKVNNEMYQDFHLFNTREEANDYILCQPNSDKFQIIEQRPTGNNGFQSQLVKWDKNPFKTKEWAEEELKNVGSEFFAREYNCLTGDTFVKIMDENGEIRNVSLNVLYEYY